MVEIARWYGERPVHATEIAQRQGIPEPYLEQLLLALRRAALVRSYRGPGGGYTLTRPPAAISLADIVAALEGPFVPPEEGLHDAEGADSDPLTCPIRDAWHLATATMRRILDGMTLEILVDRGAALDGRADQWALAVVLYRMLGGKLPFDGVGLQDVLQKVKERAEKIRRKR